MAKQQKQSEDPFKVGAEVEVSFDDEGIRGSWYSATVIRSLSKRSNSTNNNRLFLEFLRPTSAARLPPETKIPSANTSTSSSSAPCPLAGTTVLSESARRLTPSTMTDGGRASSSPFSKALDTPSSSAAPVNEQLEFPQSGLRLHREWVPPFPFPFPEESSEVKPPAPAARPPSTTPAKG